MAEYVTGQITAMPSVVTYTQEYEWVIDYDQTSDVNPEEGLLSPVFTTDNNSCFYEVFLEMLRYIYSGKVNGIDKIVGELLVAADKYSLNGLKQMCERSLSYNINAENILDTLKLANQYSFTSLKAKSIEFIVTQAADIVDKPEFRQLPYNIVCDVCSAMFHKKK